jgi:hypothetical protein
MTSIHRNTVDVIRVILELSILDPHKYYSTSNLSKIQSEVLEDFTELGFVDMGHSHIRITYLLWNFLYQKPVLYILSIP